MTQTGEWAAAVAQLDRTIEEFPGGYETVLGERGINLSGGQKQRASLARALARKPSIVLLDDALSAVDTHTEAEILRALREALAGRTAFIASHRISAIRDASWIIVLEEGQDRRAGAPRRADGAAGAVLVAAARQQLLESVEIETRWQRMRLPLQYEHDRPSSIRRALQERIRALESQAREAQRNASTSSRRATRSRPSSCPTSRTICGLRWRRSSPTRRSCVRECWAS